MIVSASRTPRARASLPRFTTVIDGEQLDATISTSLDDVFRFVPSLTLVREGARGGRAQLSLRGLDPNHLVVLVDGVRLNDPTNARGGSFDPTTLSLALVDRVEIVRGPLSAVYGSDALAGAINIVTRATRPDDPPRIQTRIRGGRFHAIHATGRASTGLAGVAGFSLGAAYDSSRDPHSDGGYDGASLRARLDLPLPFAIDFSAQTRLHQSSARGFPESSGGSRLAVIRDMEDRDVRELSFGGTLSRAFEAAGRLTARASHVRRRERTRSPGIDRIPPLDPIVEGDVPPSRASDEYARTELALLGEWTPPRAEVAGVGLTTRTSIGTEAIWEHGRSDGFLDFTGTGTSFVPFPFFDHRRTISAFVELEERVGPYVTLSGSLRFDSTPDENDRLSPSAGLSVALLETGLTLYGNYGEGFKRPSFFALGNPLVGSATLRNETSRGFEIGLRGVALDGRLRAQLGYFDLVVRNLIDFDDATFRLLNRSRLVSRGVELEFDWRVNGWLELRGGVTFNDTNFAGTGGPNPENRPRWRGFATAVARPFERIELTLRVLGQSSVRASSFRTGGRVDRSGGYERIDLRVAWRARDWLQLFAEVENLSDRTDREAVGFEAPGIAPRIGLTLSR